MYLKFTLVFSIHFCNFYSLFALSVSLLYLFQDHEDWLGCFALQYVLPSLHGSSNTSVVVILSPRVFFTADKQHLPRS